MSAFGDGNIRNMVCIFNLPENDTRSTRSPKDVEILCQIINCAGVYVLEQDMINVERMGKYRGSPRPIKVEFATNSICMSVIAAGHFYYYQPRGFHDEVQVNAKPYKPKPVRGFNYQDRQRMVNEDDGLERAFGAMNLEQRSQGQGRGQRRLPDGWLDYSEMGRRIPRTRIVAIKTPLKSEFNAGYTPQQVISLAETRGHKVGMIVNLTFTDKYYDPRAFTDRGIKFGRVKVPGKVIPQEHLVQDFIRLLVKFENERRFEFNDDVIMVHCTHGLNRTGYMVCRYLMRVKRMTSQEAIRSFNQARGHDMERDNYLQSLRSYQPGR